MRTVVVVAVALSIFAVRPARAQNADVPALIKVIETQPSDMDRSTWKEKRRDAAKKLAQSKDKRAVPTLAKLAESETFDIIGEIAIEGLGALGDPSAVPTLQKIAADNARDKGQRELAKKALARLGAAETGEAKPSPPPAGSGLETGGGPSAGTGSAAPPSGGGPPSSGGPPTSGVSDTSLLGQKPSATDLPPLPELSDDTLSAYDRVTFSAGTASFAYDTLRKRLDFEADVAGTYSKRVERQALAYGFDAGAHLVTGLIDPSGAAQTRGAELTANGDGEVRFYSGQVYGIGKAAVSGVFDYASDIDNNGNATKQTAKQADLEVAIGAGWGRVLDIGGAIRVRRLARTLDAAKALGKPIDAATAKKLQLTWWALRGERSTYRALVATVAILREAGILLGEPDAGLSFEILNVLRDTWLYTRPSGLDIQVAFGEGYLYRPSDMNGAMYPQQAEQGRIDQLLALAGYGAQLADDKVEIAGSAFARLRLFAPDPQGSPWAIGGTASLRRFTYGEHGDPFGMADLTGDVALSDDGVMMSQKQLHVGGSLGFTYWMNQASGLRLAAQLAEDGGAFFLGAQLQATYGLLDGTFAR